MKKINKTSLGLRNLAKSFVWICCIGLPLASCVRPMVVPGGGPRTYKKCAGTAEIETTVGKEFTIELDSNITTGYGWQLQKAVDEALVKAVGDKEYETTPSPLGWLKEPPPGRGGKEFWTFKALQPGQTTIDFKHVRRWETDEPPAETASFRVVIKGAAEAVTPAPDIVSGGGPSRKNR